MTGRGRALHATALEASIAATLLRAALLRGPGMLPRILGAPGSGSRGSPRLLGRLCPGCKLLCARARSRCRRRRAERAERPIPSTAALRRPVRPAVSRRRSSPAPTAMTRPPAAPARPSRSSMPSTIPRSKTTSANSTATTGCRPARRRTAASRRSARRAASSLPHRHDRLVGRDLPRRRDGARGLSELQDPARRGRKHRACRPCGSRRRGRQHWGDRGLELLRRPGVGDRSRRTGRVQPSGRGDRRRHRR